MQRRASTLLATLVATLLLAAAAWWLWPSSAPRAVASGTQPALLDPARSFAATPASTPDQAARDGGALAPGPPSSVEPQGGFGGEAENLPSLLEQIAAVHGIVAQADVSAYLQKNAELAAKNVERFCEEAKRLPKEPLFSDSRRQRDAASFLAERVDWDPMVEKPYQHGSLHLPEALADKVTAIGKEWPEALSDADLQGLDFTWMRELQSYDSWSLSAAGPLKDFAGDNLFEAPVPLYGFFVRWSKLRFARALRQGDLPQAAAEVRHLAELLHTQGMLIGDMFSVVLRRVEREAFEAAARQGRSLDGWVPPPSSEDLDRYRRLSRATPHFFFPGVDPQVMARAIECAPSPCSAMTEAAFMHAALGELAPTNTSESFWPLLEGHTCDGRLMAKIRSGKPITPTQAFGALGDTPQLLEKMFPSAP